VSMVDIKRPLRDRVPAAGAAESFDGRYTGTLSCPAFPGQTPLRTNISVTVAESTATYEREILRPGTAAGVPTGVYERGRGPVSPSGEIILTGACSGEFSCTAEYRDDLNVTPIRLTGTQRWRFRGGDRERACEVALVRRKP